MSYCSTCNLLSLSRSLRTLTHSYSHFVCMWPAFFFFFLIGCKLYTTFMLLIFLNNRLRLRDYRWFRHLLPTPVRANYSLISFSLLYCECVCVFCIVLVVNVGFFSLFLLLYILLTLIRRKPGLFWPESRKRLKPGLCWPCVFFTFSWLYKRLRPGLFWPSSH